MIRLYATGAPLCLRLIFVGAMLSMFYMLSMLFLPRLMPPRLPLRRFDAAATPLLPPFFFVYTAYHTIRHACFRCHYVFHYVRY